jgi:hypothetical protein
MLAIPSWLFSGSRCKLRTRSTKSATSTIVDHACSCASTQARSTLTRPACINDSMVGLSHGRDPTATDEYSVRPWATSCQFGRTRATSESSRTLSSGPCEGRPSRRTSHFATPGSRRLVSVPEVRTVLVCDFRSGSPSGERPLCAGTGHASCYSITASARASIAGAISRPSLLAVLRLMINSNLVGCSIGRSADLAPLRILSTK